MADDRPISWDLDSVLNLNMTWYREQYPYPYFHYLPAHTHIVNRASFIAPLHFFFEWLLVSILFYLLRNVVEAVILNPLCRAIRIKPGDKHVFIESCLQGGYYSISWPVLAWFLIHEDFLWDPMYIFEGNYPNQPMSMPYYCLYLTQLGWYTFNLYTHVFLDARKKDFWKMLTHHFVTIALIYLSLVSGCYRWGLLTLFSHDICDVFLHMCKLLKYIDNAIGIPSWVPFVFFPPIPISWLIFRLGIFPRAVVWQAIVCPQLGVGDCQYHMVFVTLLVTLLLLQVYWFVLILKVAMRKLKGKSWEDVREKKEPKRISVSNNSTISTFHKEKA